MTTVAQARRALALRFRQIGIESADLDARILVAHVLNAEHAALAARPDRILTQDEQRALGNVAQRRESYEPVARIVGTKEFWGLNFALSPETLVPRPETELVVECALEQLAPLRNDPLSILDVGTGSGAILLALLHECPRANGLATDISRAALRAAHANARALGLQDRAHFVACDMAAALRGPFDIVVSNPPYIPTADIADLDPDVREHDPHPALDGGADGLDAYRALAAQTPALLAAAGALIVEIGIGQAAGVTALLHAAGFTGIDTRHDLAGIPRVLRARR